MAEAPKEKFSPKENPFKIKGEKMNEGYYLKATHKNQMLAYFSKAKRIERKLNKQSKTPEVHDVTFKKGGTKKTTQEFKEWLPDKIDQIEYIDTLYKAIRSLYKESGAYDQPGDEALLDYHVTRTICAILEKNKTVDVNDVLAKADRLEVDFSGTENSQTIKFIRKDNGQEKVLFTFNTNDTVDYESGLQNAFFSSGPGGSWNFKNGSYAIVR